MWEMKSGPDHELQYILPVYMYFNLMGNIMSMALIFFNVQYLNQTSVPFPAHLRSIKHSIISQSNGENESWHKTNIMLPDLYPCIYMYICIEETWKCHPIFRLVLFSAFLRISFWKWVTVSRSVSPFRSCSALLLPDSSRGSSGSTQMHFRTRSHPGPRSESRINKSYDYDTGNMSPGQIFGPHLVGIGTGLLQ
jgi:hypothetical protein